MEVVFDGECHALLEKEGQVVGVLVLIIFDDQDSEGLSFLQFKQVIVGLLGPHPLEHRLEPILKPNIQQTPVATLVIQQREHCPRQQKPLKRNIFLLKLLQRYIRRAPKQILHGTFFWLFKSHTKRVNLLKEVQRVL